MLKVYEKMLKTKKPNCWIYETVEPFSEEEEEMMNLLILAEKDGCSIEYEVREDEDGNHTYRLRKRELEQFYVKSGLTC